jgi:hypothetical protein
MKPLRWTRTLRTPHSERLLATCDGQDTAAVDLHYLSDGTVAGTVTLLKGAAWGAEQVPALLAELDQDWLPGVDLGSGRLTFTVVMGEVVGNFEPDGPSQP